MFAWNCRGGGCHGPKKVPSYQTGKLTGCPPMLSLACNHFVYQLGEGGYSFVYLVRELPTEEHPAIPESFYALKKVCLNCLAWSQVTGQA